MPTGYQALEECRGLKSKFLDRLSRMDGLRSVDADEPYSPNVLKDQGIAVDYPINAEKLSARDVLTDCSSTRKEQESSKRDRSRLDTTE